MRSVCSVEASAADALGAALTDPDPLVQGRAAEGLGLIGHKPAAERIAAMMQPHIKAGVLDGHRSPTISSTRSRRRSRPCGSACMRWCGSARTTPLASALSTATAQPISRWWPVAYAFRRVGDPRAGAVLLTLLQGEGTMTRAFAARGLGAVKEARAVAPLVAILGNDREVDGRADRGGAIARRARRRRRPRRC